MIKLITGSPGSGKTCFAVSELLKAVGTDKAARPIFVDGITGLKIPHEVCDASKWDEWAPDGALIIIDEVQRLWRPRATGAKVPSAIQALETHRHKGIDFIIITQHPSLVDTNVRKLVAVHIHLVAKWAGRFAYEWPECKSDPQSVGDAVKRPYTLDKAAFKQYKSAEIHTKVEKKLPLAVYALGACLLVAIGIGWRISSRVSDMTGSANVAALPTPSPSSRPVVQVKDISDPNIWRPRVAMRPETAPAYDGLLKVQAVPNMKACVVSVKGCTCYTEQATPYPVREDICRQFATGRVFDPFARPLASEGPQPQKFEIERKAKSEDGDARADTDTL